jgi:hypothetical protein
MTMSKEEQVNNGKEENKYSLRSILLFANTDASTTKMCLDTSILAKSIMGRREYLIYPESLEF